MSATLFDSDILFLQRLLRAEGLYKAQFNSKWDADTEYAFTRFELQSREISAEIGTFDSRSEQAIQTLSLRAQREARLSLRRLLDSGVRARVLSGTRTYAEQDVLYRKGRFGNPGPVVTKARGGHSNHNFGIAWDIGIFTPAGGYLTDHLTYEKAATVAVDSTLEWGGTWKSFADRPHYQLQLNVSVSALREKFEDPNGSVLFA